MNVNITEEACQWVKKNKKYIINKFVGEISPVDKPVSLFIAGSPGSGKTEYSKSFIKDLNKIFQEKYNKNYPIIRIDVDDIRLMFPKYNGNNASIFQKASVLAANKLHDYALNKGISFLFDGTLSNEKYALENIKRSIKKGRRVQIFYMFQDPINAWKFTLARMSKDGREVPMDIFINNYFLAKEVVSKVKSIFLNEIIVDLIIRNHFNGERKIYFDIDSIDDYVDLTYNKETLKEKLMRINY